MFKRLSWAFRFAFSEIRNEWLFGLGVALAVCSVLTPTSLLWGTKSGMIDTMRSQLLKDPMIRELVGQENDALPVAWFDEMRKDPRVAFVVPSVRRISLYGNVSKSSRPDKFVEVSYLPTAAGDPVGGGLDWDPRNAELPVPSILTARGAEDLGVIEGDIIIVEQSRFEDGKTAKASFRSRVKRVLAAHESNTKALYLPLFVIERIEDYKDGRPVGIFGWNRSEVSPMEIYDSFRLNLTVDGEGGALALATKMAGSSKGVRLVAGSDGRQLEFLSTGDGVEHEKVVEIAGYFTAFKPRIELMASGECLLATTQEGGASRPIRYSPSTSASLTLEELVALPLVSEKQSEGAQVAWLEVPCGDGENSQVGVVSRGASLESGVIEISPRLVGVFGAAKRRAVEFNEATGGFRPLRAEYPGFRLYARDLEDVMPLRRLCESQGIQVRTNEDRIQGVLSLDAALGKFLLFIVLAGGVGGVGALFTSLYLSIERSRRQYAVLQIIGIPKSYVLVSAMVQGVLLVIVGTLFSFILFRIGSWLLSAILTPGMGEGANVCRLSLGQWILLLCITVSAAIVSALLASTRLRFADPALIARSE